MKWKTLQHNGIRFPPPYKSRRIKIRIGGEEVDLDIKQEEMIYQWAKKKDTPYVQDSVFQKNFTMDFAKILNRKFRKVSYKDIDFSDAYEIVDKEKAERERKKEEEKKARTKKREEEKKARTKKREEEKKARTKKREEEKKARTKKREEEKEAMAKMAKEEKKAFAKKIKEERAALVKKKEEERAALVKKKEEERAALVKKKEEERAARVREKNAERDKLKKKYGTAVMDGKKVDIANYMAEPPGIFIGRGDHPLRGRWKPRIDCKDVTLNLGEKPEVPKGDWGKIVFQNDATWLAKWTDYLTGNTKYVWLADTAGVKQDKDKEKYDKATMLGEEIDKIWNSMVRDMKSKDEKTRTVATVCYLIYRTAMRVGDEKDPDEADTVGATTLRKEHISITKDAVKFDFLGKDSVRWQETVKAEGHDRQFQENLKRIIDKKKPRDEIFGKITSRRVNAYYSGIAEGMTAKVFRTYLATKVVKDYLAKYDTIKEKSADTKIHHAKLANLEAAKKCNHKRTIPKTFEKGLQKRMDNLKIKMEKKPWEKTEKRRIRVKASEPKTDVQRKNKNKRIRRLNKQIREQKERRNMQIEKIKLQITLTGKTKDYNLGTSLRNYIDPRMFKAWADHVGVEWEKMYTSALQKKFLWVQNEKPKWSEMSR